MVCFISIKDEIIKLRESKRVCAQTGTHAHGAGSQ
jgi:hypothetical protein